MRYIHFLRIDENIIPYIINFLGLCLDGITFKIAPNFCIFTIGCPAR